MAGEELTISQPPRSARSVRVSGTPGNSTIGLYRYFANSGGVVYDVQVEAEVQQIGGLNTIDEVQIFSFPFASLGSIFVFNNTKNVSLTKQSGIIVPIPITFGYSVTAPENYIQCPPPVVQKLPPDFTYFKVYAFKQGTGQIIPSMFNTGTIGQQLQTEHWLNVSGW